MKKERKQKYLDTFIERVNGLGAAISINSGDCVYIKANHPGCAIGCQPEFATFLAEFMESKQASLNVAEGDINGLGSFSTMCHYANIAPKHFLDSENDTDGMEFLIALQKLHDAVTNWQGTKLLVGAVEKFCWTFGLRVPTSNYA